MRRMLLVLGVFLTLLSPSQVQAQAKVPLLKALETGAKGRPLYLAWSRDGIEAATPDGKFRKKLYDKPVDSAAYGTLAELLWFVADNKLQVLDLRLPQGEPRVVVDNFQAKDFIIGGLGGAASSTAQEGFLLQLVLGATPQITVRPPLAGQWDEAANQKAQAAAKTASVVAMEWLTAQAQRKLLLPPPPPRPGQVPPGPEPELKLNLPEQQMNCRDQAACGRNQPLGKTGLRVAVVFQDCAGACLKKCILVDGTGTQFTFPLPQIPKDAGPTFEAPQAEPPEMPCGPFLVHAKGEYWLLSKKVCSKAGCVRVDGQPFAWLGPEPYLTDLR